MARSAADWLFCHFSCVGVTKYHFSPYASSLDLALFHHVSPWDSVHFDLEDILCLLSTQTGADGEKRSCCFLRRDRDKSASEEKEYGGQTGIGTGFAMMEEVKEVAVGLSVCRHTIRVTEAVKEGDTLTFVIVSEKLSGTGEYHVDRTYEDFEWLQQHLCSQEDVPGIQGVIFPPLPVKAHGNPSAKVIKQLGFLGMGEWGPYCMALEMYLHQVAMHNILSTNKAVETFLTSSDPPGRQKMRKNIFNRLSHAMEEMRKESHKDVDEFFQVERDHNLSLTGYSKTATERFLDVVLTEQKIATAFAHFSTALRLCVEPGGDPETQAFSKICVKLSEVFDTMKANMTSVAENNMTSLGLGLDMDSRYQEAEKEMLFRRTCKLVELENASRNAEKAKPVKKAVMEGVRKAAEKEFDHISGVAKQEITRFHAARTEILQQAMIRWCEKQLQTAKQTAEQYGHHLQALRGMA